MRSKKLSILFLALVLSGGVFAGLPQLQDDESQIADTGGSSTPVTPVTVTASDQGAATFSVDDSAPCSKNIENSLSLATIKSITKGGKSISVTPGEKVIDKNGKKVTVKDYDNLQVSVPSHVQQCLNLGMSARKLGNDVILEFRNLHVFTPSSAYDGKTGDQKLEKCLSEDVANDKGEKVTGKVIEGGKFIPNLLNVPVSRPVVVSKGDKEIFDITKDVNIYFASIPTGNTHIPAYNRDLVNPSGASKCFVYEQPSTKGMKLIDRSGLYAYKNMEDCDGQCGAIISEAMGELQMGNIGNGNALYDILQKARNKLLDADVKRKEKKLEEITKALLEIKDEQKLREKMREYVSILSDYENFPQKARLDELRLLYSKLDKGEGDKDEIQKRIKELKSAIGEISIRKYGTDVAKKKAQELGLKDDGVFIVKMKLTSAYFSDKQNLGNAVVLNPDQAQEKLDSEMKVYNKEAMEFQEVYESKAGLANHSNKYDRQAAALEERSRSAWKKFHKKEYESGKACAPKAFNFSMNGQNMTDPRACMSHRAGQRRRYERMMFSDNENRKNRSIKLNNRDELRQYEDKYTEMMNNRDVASDGNGNGNDDYVLEHSSAFSIRDEYSGEMSDLYQMNGAPGYQGAPMFPQQQMQYQQPMFPQQQMQYQQPMFPQQQMQYQQPMR
jgi:hypothetical protein